MGSLSCTPRSPSTAFTTPYRVVKDGVVTDEIVHLDATQEEDKVIAQANAEMDEKTGKLKGPRRVPTREGELVLAAPKDVDLMDVSPNQIWSVATTLIPFLEHDDANRALMGSNMQRQAVPLLKTDPPLVGTGMERRAASTPVTCAGRGGRQVTYVDAERIVDREAGVPAREVHALEPGHADPPEAAGRPGQKVKKGDLLADGSSTTAASWRSARTCLVAFMSWEGYNFEDAIIISERLVKDDELSSIHIEEYEIDARTTKLGDEEITRDIPNRSRSRCATSTTAASSASAPRSAPATCWSARSRRRARPS